ncbi:MAG: rRNA cytosine-C5-methyltransferase [Tannerella sp.]|jgi:16S rRNA C967 or C1407 C5-methylase (RsmB/RsmF family)/NOL1/NOP2/fmu family ribosome biogenesis protein|nr:rRNA cytosine-C5-methyltransferase [Tannerella sp.]
MIKQDFITRTRELLKDEYDALEAALMQQPPVSIRLNPLKTSDALQPFDDSFQSENVAWCKAGRYLAARPSFTLDPLFHAGVYYVQEAASMFLEQALSAADMNRDRIVALDLCAAPGGKSTHLQTLLPQGSLLVCNELVRSRSVILAENMAKWGGADNIVTCAEPALFGECTNLFDVVLADLPCSGEGMFRKNPDSCNEWSADNVNMCANRQRRIIRDVWNSLKPGGWLIYSTCTYNTAENEDNVALLAKELGAEIVAIPVNREWNISGSLGCDMPAYRFFPHRTKGEGFFLALLRKNSGYYKESGFKNKVFKPFPATQKIRGLLGEPEKFVFLNNNSANLYAVPERHEGVYSYLSKSINIVSWGVYLGALKGADLIPSASLAMNAAFRRASFPSAELTLEDAIKYLRKEAIELPADMPLGHILVTYKNVPLGFVKNLQNRSNNLYPTEWRIRNKLKVKNEQWTRNNLQLTIDNDFVATVLRI